MIPRAKDLVRAAFRTLGLEISVASAGSPSATNLADTDTWVQEIATKVAPFTMTSPERVAALCMAMDYVSKRAIPGDFVECGVWRGGSSMAAAWSLLRNDGSHRTLHLYDTFEGMPPPTDLDRRFDGIAASQILAGSDPTSMYWARSSLEDVRRNVALTGYPHDKINYIPGKVEETIPHKAPKQIAVLRLDTDWYESTKHELEHLYPRLSEGGVLIIDDYGHWQGARRAVDEYFTTERPILLNRIDDTGRISIKA